MCVGFGAMKSLSKWTFFLSVRPSFGRKHNFFRLSLSLSLSLLSWMFVFGAQVRGMDHVRKPFLSLSELRYYSVTRALNVGLGAFFLSLSSSLLVWGPIRFLLTSPYFLFAFSPSLPSWLCAQIREVSDQRLRVLLALKEEEVVLSRRCPFHS